jgi:hypothetical protein
VRTHATGATEISTLFSEPTTLGEFAAGYVRSWRFLPAAPRAFELRFRYSLLGRRSCDDRATEDDPNTDHIVIARLPTEIEVSDRADLICDEPEPLAGDLALDRFSLTVVCACIESTPVAGAEVSIVSEVGRGRRVVHRAANTDVAGQVRIDELRPGPYLVRITASGFAPAVYRIRVGVGLEKPAAIVRLSPQKRTIPRVSIRSAAIPYYPVSALEAGESGDVIVTVSGAARVVGDTPAAKGTLGIAALDHSKTLRTSGGSAEFSIRYQYRLLPGDCTSDQRTTVTMKFPHSIEVAAKRRIPCFAAVQGR